MKDWLKREEILSLYRSRQPGSSKNTAAIKFGWCFCFGAFQLELANQVGVRRAIRLSQAVFSENRK